MKSTSVTFSNWENWELYLVLIFSYAALIAIPLFNGEMGISWDALNHHIYLGWTAERPRFNKDLFAASGQSVQYPYLYWPFFKLAQSGMEGKWAGVVLASIQWTAVPPIWWIAKNCIQGKDIFAVWMRTSAVVLAFMSGVILSMFDSTSNDLLAAIPCVWAIAFAINAIAYSGSHKKPVLACAALSGLFCGISAAFKLSNGPIVILLPLLWVFPPGSIKLRIWLLLAGGFATIVGFLIAYGYWGWQLWTAFGNPLYPFYDNLFEPIRIWADWKP